MILIAGGIAGGIYFRDKTLVDTARSKLAAAQQAESGGDPEAAANAWAAVLEAATGVGNFTPLNKEALELERQALAGIEKARAAAAAKTAPLAADRALQRLPTDDAELQPLRDKLRTKLGEEAVSRLEKGGYTALEKVWKALEADGGLTEDLKARRAAGLKRSRTRRQVDELIADLRARRFAKIRDELGKGAGLLADSRAAFSGGFESDLQQLGRRLDRAKVVLEAWDSLARIETAIGAVAETVTGTGLGALADSGKLDKITLPTLDAKKAGEEFSELVKAFETTRASLEETIAELTKVAKDYKGMALVSRRDEGDLSVLLFMETLEVSQARWKAFVEAGGYGEEKRSLWSEAGARECKRRRWTGPDGWTKGSFPTDRPDGSLPVTGVSFFEAEAFAKWSGKRIPKREEWLKAAIGDERRLFPWGADWDASRVNLRGDESRPLPVTALPGSANADGIRQLYGNVQEWCSAASADDRRTVYLLGGSFQLAASEVELLAKRIKASEAGADELFKLMEINAIATQRRRDAGVRLVRDLTWNRKTRRVSR